MSFSKDDELYKKALDIVKPAVKTYEDIEIFRNRMPFEKDPSQVPTTKTDPDGKIIKGVIHANQVLESDPPQYPVSYEDGTKGTRA